MEFSVHHQVLLAVLLVAIVLGAGMHKTRFCTMGGVSDWINMDHKGRLGAWFFAIAIAIGGVLILEAAGVLAIQNKTLGASFPPYRTAQFAWLRYLLGGLLFGVGMTLAGGCGSRTIVRVGSGSLKSLTVLIVASIVTYYMLWTDLYQKLFMVWIAPTTINLARWGVPSQELGALVGSFGLGNATLLHFIFGGILVALVLYFVLRQRDFRSDWNNPIGGAVVGLAVVAGWFITGGPLSEAWGEHALLASEPPIRVATQSFTFISPMGDAVNFLLGRRFSLVSFGLVSMLGVILGSALYALVSGKFRIERFASVADFVNHVIGAILLGVGGVLAMGCSIGQGITGVSTLALGSLIALGAMIFGAAFTMKVQYYLLDDTGFLRALRLTVADLRLLPKPRAV